MLSYNIFVGISLSSLILHMDGKDSLGDCLLSIFDKTAPGLSTRRHSLCQDIT
jgi:hypothetical protein